jgi:hypothetical protein
MNPPATLRREEFDQLVAEHQRLIHLANDLECQLYRLSSSAEQITACQQAGGALIGLLRHVLFRHDQQVLPVLETLVPDAARMSTGREKQA